MSLESAVNHRTCLKKMAAEAAELLGEFYEMPEKSRVGIDIRSPWARFYIVLNAIPQEQDIDKLSAIVFYCAGIMWEERGSLSLEEYVLRAGKALYHAKQAADEEKLAGNKFSMSEKALEILEGTSEIGISRKIKEMGYLSLGEGEHVKGLPGLEPERSAKFRQMM